VAFTDRFIQRPVLASVVSLLILILGLRALTLLEVRQYPQIENTVVTITTAYPGASSALVKGFITTPLQQAIAEADGIDYLSSSSRQGLSTIEAHMRLNYDPNAAVAQIQAKVASQRGVLPADAQDPVISAATGEPTALMYMAFYSEAMSAAQISDYLARVVQPQLQALEGVGNARVIGDKRFALRVWLDPTRMAALNISANEVAAALRANNYLAAVGESRGRYVAIDLGADTDVGSAEAFAQLVLQQRGERLIRLQDIATVALESEDLNSAAWYKGTPAVFVGIEQAPGANPLSVAARIHQLLPTLRDQLPAGLQVRIPYDASLFIQDSIDEVFKTLAEAVLIVLLVIYLSLGSMRAALIPALTVPLSLIGGALLMLLLGYSINLLTLLAMVLAIGLVVDDAIIVVENVHRHIERGEQRLQAALLGARELALPIIAMTTTLVAVYAPIGFMGGLVGTLFTEFAFTLAGAVLISGVVALTLSPMLASRVLHDHGSEGRLEQWIERAFSALSNSYRRLLQSLLQSVSLVLLVGFSLLVSIGAMYQLSKQELAPTEDQSILFFMANGPQSATLDYSAAFGREMVTLFEQIPEHKESFILLGFGGSPGSLFGGFKMPSVDERVRSQMSIQPQLQGLLSQVAGFQIAIFPRPSLPGGGRGLPIQFVLTSDADYATLDELAGELIGYGMASGQFMFLKRGVAFDRPRSELLIDRDRAADLGIDMATIGQTLALLVGEGEINRFSLDERSYKVIPQLAARFRADPDQLRDLYLRTDSGALVPLDMLVTLRQQVEPAQRNQFQQLNALTIEGMALPNRSLGEALAVLQQGAAELLPDHVNYDYTGQSRQFMQQGSALMITFFLSLLVIYLVLAAQFESWRDPLIILMSVPMSIAGAMAFIMLDFATINIYTQVGLITLIGVVAKNGILIVEFANQLQIQQQLSRLDAVVEAATIRLRPILMTTGAMVLAMLPLLLATGPGAVSRFHIGLVIAAGLGIGTLFTLFVVPAVYLVLARRHVD